MYKNIVATKAMLPKIQKTPWIPTIFFTKGNALATPNKATLNIIKLNPPAKPLNREGNSSPSITPGSIINPIVFVATYNKMQIAAKKLSDVYPSRQLFLGYKNVPSTSAEIVVPIPDVIANARRPITASNRLAIIENKNRTQAVKTAAKKWSKLSLLIWLNMSTA